MKEDFSKIQTPFCMSIVGQTRSGKSTLLQRMLQKIKSKFDTIVVLCPTLNLNGDYDWLKTTKKQQVFKASNEDKIREMLQKITEIQLENKTNKQDENVLVILDDCLSTESKVLSHHSKEFSSLSTKGRHYNISVICTSQKFKGISNTFRMNSMYFVMFGSKYRKELEAFTEEFLFSHEKKAFLKAMQDYFSTRYNYLVVDNFDNMGDTFQKGFGGEPLTW